MLQNKKEYPYISLFKLNTGEEFICSVVEETDKLFTVSKPLCLVGTQNGGVGFAPLFLMADGDKLITIPKPVIEAVPAANVIAEYESSVSGIALPKKSSIII